MKCVIRRRQPSGGDIQELHEDGVDCRNVGAFRGYKLQRNVRMKRQD